MTFSMTCTCGEVMNVDAKDRNEGVKKMKAMMTQDAIDEHYAEKHSDEPVPPMREVHSDIATNLQEVI